MPIRRQATLYLPSAQAAAVERLRSTYNPEQQALIRAHVTLCREDEVDDWAELADRLASLPSIAVVLSFGAPVRSANLVYLPTVGSASSFDELRAMPLARPGRALRKHEPHITLIHPRTARARMRSLQLSKRHRVRSMPPF